MSGFSSRASSSWQLAGTGQTSAGLWSFAVDGAKAQIDFAGLGSFSEIKVVCRSLTAAASGVRVVRVSVDGGATFYSASGDYQNVDSAGAESASTGFAHSTASTVARSHIVHILNTKGATKSAISHSTSAIQTVFVASASDINAIRVENTGGGNITGGTIEVYAR